MRFLLILVSTVATCLPVTTLVGQDKSIQQEFGFARGLVLEFGLVDLAEEVLHTLSTKKGLDAETLRAIRLEKCKLPLHATLFYGRLDTKVKFYRQGLARIVPFLEQCRTGSLACELRILLAKAVIHFGELLKYKKAQEPDPKIKTIISIEANGIYRLTIKELNQVRSWTEEKKPHRNMFLKAWKYLGELKKNYAEFALTPGERKNRLEGAIEELETYIFDFACEGNSPASIDACISLAQCMELSNDKEAAKDTYFDVKETIWDDLHDEDMQVSPAVIPMLAKLMERAYANYMRILLDLDKPGEAVKKGQEMVSRMATLNAKPSDQYGLLALVYFARALIATGDPDKGILYLDLVVKQAPMSLVAKMAKMSFAHVQKFSFRVTPQIHYMAAENAFNRGEYISCLRRAKAVLRSLSTSAEKREFGLISYVLMGRSFRSLNRFVEAAFAYGQGCLLYGDMGPGDIRYKSRVTNAAIRCNAFTQQAWRKAKKDPNLKPLHDFSRRVLPGYPAPSPDPMIYFEAKSLIHAGKYGEAERVLAFITKKSDYYERAMVQLGKINWV